MLDDLRRVTHYARQKERLFVEHISRRDAQAAKREVAHLQRELDKLKKREAELTTLFKRLYEDNVLGASQMSSMTFSPPSISMSEKP